MNVRSPRFLPIWSSRLDCFDRVSGLARVRATGTIALLLRLSREARRQRGSLCGVPPVSLGWGWFVGDQRIRRADDRLDRGGGLT